jgi:Leucine-rich repeat (LRR) protein
MLDRRCLCLLILCGGLVLAGCDGSPDRPTESGEKKQATGIADGGLPVPFRDLDRYGAHAFKTTDGVSVYLHDPARGDADVGGLLQTIGASPELIALRLARTSISDASLTELGKLTQLRELDLAATPVTDAGLAALSGLVGLQRLDLEATQITDAGLPALAALSQLQWLSLARTKVTGAGLRSLEPLVALETLDLSETTLTDADLERFAAWKQLERLRVFGTSLSPGAAAELRRTRPQLLVVQ